MESGTIVKWLKGEGDAVEKGEPLYELDTDKVTQEVEAEASGVLLKIAVNKGEVTVGRTIAVIGEAGEEVSLEQEPEAPTKEEPKQAAPEPPPRRDENGRPEQVEQTGGRVKASPLARRIARERGIDLASLSGTGPEGRIVAEDVERSEAAPAAAEPVPAGEAERRELTSTRKTIARRLTEAWQIPVFQLQLSADMSRVNALLARLRDDESAPKTTVTDVLDESLRHSAHAPPRGERAVDGRRHPAAPDRERGARRRCAARPRGARHPQRRAAHARRNRDGAGGSRLPRARRQAPTRRHRGRNVHDLEPRHVRSRELHRSPEPAAGRDRGCRRCRRSSRSDRRRGRRSPDADPHRHLRPPGRRRRPRRRLPPDAQGAAGGARVDAVRIWYQVRDLEAARAFYTGMLGFTETFVDEAGGWVALDRPPTEIALAAGEPAEDAGVATIDVDDVKGERERLAAAGVEVGTTVELHGAIRVLDVFDPDGNRLQLAEEVE